MCGKYNAGSHVATKGHYSAEEERATLDLWLGTIADVRTLAPVYVRGANLPNHPQHSMGFGPVFAKALFGRWGSGATNLLNAARGT